MTLEQFTIETLTDAQSYEMAYFNEDDISTFSQSLFAQFHFASKELSIVSFNYFKKVLLPRIFLNAALMDQDDALSAYDLYKQAMITSVTNALKKSNNHNGLQPISNLYVHHTYVAVDKTSKLRTSISDFIYTRKMLAHEYSLVTSNTEFKELTTFLNSVYFGKTVKASKFIFDALYICDQATTFSAFQSCTQPGLLKNAVTLYHDKHIFVMLIENDEFVPVGKIPLEYVADDVLINAVYEGLERNSKFRNPYYV